MDKFLLYHTSLSVHIIRDVHFQVVIMPFPLKHECSLVTSYCEFVSMFLRVIFAFQINLEEIFGVKMLTG